MRGVGVAFDPESLEFCMLCEEIFFPSKPLGLDFSKSIPMTVKGVKKDRAALFLEG